MKKNKNISMDWGSNFIARHPVIANMGIILIISVLGLYAVYVAIALFTKHGESDELPGVEGKTYTEAVQILHDHGFKVDIRDSLYREDVKPGRVIEQFPKAHSIVKPGRKVFLYINAVHPREVVLDNNHPAGEAAMKGESFRSAMAKLEELGFKNIKVVKVLGPTDRVVKVTANGRLVKKMEKVPVTASIVLEVSDGRLAAVKDSLQIEELKRNYEENPDIYENSEPEVTETESENSGESQGENPGYFE
ncbi:MAG: PASTA domain-containing protein [Bacteroides sp.]|nr:PASTA domain-containing protein [Bacteroides sp.]